MIATWEAPTLLQVIATWEAPNTLVHNLFKIKKSHFFLVALGLCCWVPAFPSCSEWGLLFFVVCGLLIAVASLIAQHGL